MNPKNNNENPSNELNSLTDDETSKISGGNKIESICKKPSVSFLLNLTKPGVKELMQNKEFTNKLSNADINNKPSIQKLFKDHGVELTERQVNTSINLIKPFL